MKPDFDDRRAGLPPPRFSLATMLWVVGALGVLFAAMTYVGSYAMLLLILFALAIFAHVAGNALGTRLREHGDRPLRSDGETPTKSPAWQRAADSDFAPTTRLGTRYALGKPTLIATVVGVVLGGVLGGGGLTLMMERMTVSTVGLAVFASAVLGGIWAFLAASFVQVSFGAAWQATRDSSTGDRKTKF
jgi:hypothetical protein